MLKMLNNDTQLELSTTCRVCLTRGEQLKSLLTDLELASANFIDFFTILTTIKIHSGDALPSNICQACTDRVLAAFELRTLAQRSEITLQSMVTNKLKTNSPTGMTTDAKRKFSCSSCAKAFAYKSELDRHEKTHVPHYKCDMCGKMFGFKSSLRRHQLQHERAGRVQCQLCASFFKDEKLLKRHQQYAHQTDKRHRCVDCGAEAGSASALRSHRRRHTARAERPLRCRHAPCRSAFNFEHHRRHHEATHTGVKHYFCDHCGIGFVQAHHLVSHMTSHKPDQGVRCRAAGCGKTFTTSYALKRHSSVHNNILCNVCGKLCNRKHLKKHQLGCHHKLLNGSNEASDNNFKEISKGKGTNEDIKVDKSQYAFDTDLEWNSMMPKESTSCRDILVQEIVLSNLSKESECDSQEVVRDVVDMMEGTCPTMSQYKQKDNPGLETAIEDAIIVPNCNNGYCCQISSNENNKSYVPKNTVPEKKTCASSNTNPEQMDSVEMFLNDRSKSCTSINAIPEQMGSDVKIEGCCQNKHQKPSHNSIKAELRQDRETGMQGNDCESFLGKCIVAGEDCICAKVSSRSAAPEQPEFLSAPLLVALQQQGYYPNYS